MSWKSIVITGLLCVVASPALAAPSASAKVLGLDTAGNWVWQVNVAPDAALFANNPPNGTGGSVAIEVAATASGRNLVSAAANATNFPANNPATAVPGFAFWGAADSGVKTNIATNQLVAGLGSTYFTTGGDKEAFRVHTQRPTSTATTTTLTLTGAYTSKGRLAQAGQNFDTITGAINQTVRPGNANLSQMVDVGDLGILATNYNTSGKRWQDGDFTGDGNVDVGDLGVLATNYNLADAGWATPGAINLPTTPGAGGGSVAAAGVPEPSTVVMLLLGCLSALVARRTR